MPRYEFRAPRLYVDAPLASRETVALGPAQAHRLGHVLRLRAGSRVLLFNGRDGEWAAELGVSRRAMTAVVTSPVRPQPDLEGPDYLFAPLKHARLDYVVQKAVEMGVRRLCPVLTRYTQVEALNIDRMRANVVEAAEQCGVLALSEVCQPERLDAVLDSWESGRFLVFCDECAEVRDPLEALAGAKDLTGRPPGVLIGPEGGFAPEERARLLAMPAVIPLALGPRILRADTAGVAALALVQAMLGDWARETATAG